MTKISKIVEQTKEYERLSRLIENIEKAVKDFDKINKIEGGLACDSGTLTFAGGTLTDTILADATMQNLSRRSARKRVDVFLSDTVSELIREDMKAILKKHLAKLKKQRGALEV